jgi:hypothetical protein
MAKSLYQEIGLSVDPVSALLKAVMEVNQHQLRAKNAGWDVSLDINLDTGDVMVTLTRENFPDLDEDEEPA